MEFNYKTSFMLFICFSFWNILPTSQSIIAETDRLALLAIKDKIIDDPSGVLNSWSASSHCSNWTGITCSRRHPSRVTSLVLESMGLVGSISPYIGNLSFLRVLSLYDNRFKGEIPQEVGHLSRLQTFWVANNTLTGKIPRNISSCKNLEKLVIYNNDLVGGIPTELGSLSKLQILALSMNNLGGTIPVSLSNLSVLTVFDTGLSNLHGNIPSELGQLSTLMFFGVAGNNLSGTIPPQFFNISSITAFSVSFNKFHGYIPPYIGTTLPNLEYLGLGGNTFSGLLPNSISNLSRLSVLDILDNQFTGSVPPKLGTLKDLTNLNIAKNYFGRGEVDGLSFLNTLPNCSKLEKLSISNNYFSGQLPDSIANLSTKLREMYLGFNLIFGEIHPGIENLVNLNLLGMQSNHLNGSIPAFIGKHPNLMYVSLSDNQLSGKIPSNICNSTQLNRIDFSINRLQGGIPPNFGNCQNMIELDLSQNQLTGAIPKELIGLSSITSGLELSENQLTGDLPSEVGNLERIVGLYLSNNRLSGKVPDTLGKCIGLEGLSLDGNLFEWVIPPSLKNLKGLQKLDMSGNKFSGQIPEYLESFASLRYLNLSSNDFEGEVPKQGIFKNISAFSVLGNDKLCGGIPLLHLPSCPRPSFEEASKRSPLKRLLLIIFGVVVCIILLGSFLVWFRRRKATKNTSSTLHNPLDNMFQRVSYKELVEATNGFSAENLVGVGSYGSVYRGLLSLSHEVTTVAAVKVLDLQRRGASKSFMAECEAMRCIRHRNLVKMLTSCSSIDYKGDEFKALVSEFMPNGSLEDWLHPTPNDVQSSWRPLNFMERLTAAIDVASALDYLHHHCQTPIVHCDLKPGNVLLDNDMNSHVGDFGLAKFLGGVIINVESEHHTTSTSVGIRGSVGYAAPEYGMGRDVSTQGDVYSYGIMLVEIFTGRRPTDDKFTDGLSLHTFAKTALLQDRVLEIVDPRLPAHVRLENDNNTRAPINVENETKLCEALARIFNLGVMCSVESPNERMEMAQVMKELQSIRTAYLTRQE
ncbi:probable LRR receptor-like serine/threonine-protein kinase At3g47570 [Papaver somniferum]|uniref:probable LRR receptor-like serine/threonine-protein kinase At3g47570 n=1 Tax=Papaver somniferum TaxID=3469 RepID=UPI000E700C6E|nr:probable LRR receptor-like serine/threonine-protein kinase At3g47570 [Papaver somniferum]